MKTLITLTTALLFTAGSVFAQSNDATVSQQGDDNSALVDQEGSNHEAIIDQDTWGEGHTAEVDQHSGTDNFTNILQDQRNAEAYVEQAGSNNESRLKQSGPNLAEINQAGNNNILGQYDDLSKNAFQKNGTSFADDKNWLDLDQLGDGNTAGVWQEHHGEVTISQEGDNNDSRAYQSGTRAESLNSSSTSMTGNDNSTDTYQDGEGNSASINIGPYLSDLNTIEMDQNGDDNDASFSVQMGDGNDISIDQDGSSNYSEYSVKYGDDNTITADVDGTSNRTRFSIDTEWGGMSSGNTLSVTKSGDSNYLSGSIEGDNNSVTVLQDGNGNSVGTSWYTKDGVDITGDSNTVDISQTSDNNSAYTSMTGNSNTATITQGN